MKIKSCDNCGIVIDLDKIERLPTEDDKVDYPSINTENVVWEDREYWKCVKCPHCGELINTHERV